MSTGVCVWKKKESGLSSFLQCTISSGNFHQLAYVLYVSYLITDNRTTGQPPAVNKHRLWENPGQMFCHDLCIFVLLCHHYLDIVSSQGMMTLETCSHSRSSSTSRLSLTEDKLLHSCHFSFCSRQLFSALMSFSFSSASLPFLWVPSLFKDGWRGRTHTLHS